MNHRRTFGGDTDPTPAWEDATYQNSAAVDDEDVPDGVTTTKSTTTQQSDPDDHGIDARRYRNPPYNPRHLALLTQRSETRHACIQAKSKGVAGYGFEIVPHPSLESADRDPDPGGKETAEEFWFGNETDFQLGPDRQPASANEVHVHAREDYEDVGWLALEFLVNEGGNPTGIAHVPGHTVRRRYDAPGYVQLDTAGRIDTYFGSAGDRYGDDKTFVDSETGETADSTEALDNETANELLFVRNYSPLSPYYGTPDDISALETYQGDLAARTFNRVFFDNDGVPRFVVIVENGELTDRAWDDLKENFKNLKENENAHRGIMLEGVTDIQQTAAGSDSDSNVSIRIEPLTVGVEEDQSFTEFREHNEHDILKTHGVPPVVVGRETQNYATAREQRQEFAQQTIRPRQETYAERLYEQVHVQMLDVEDWTIRFNLHNAENREREAQIANTRIDASRGVITINQLLAELGMEQRDDELGEMLVAEVLGDSAPTSTDPDPSEIVDEAGLAALVNGEIERRTAEEYEYDIVDRPNLTSD